MNIHFICFNNEPGGNLQKIYWWNSIDGIGDSWSAEEQGSIQLWWSGKSWLCAQPSRPVDMSREKWRINMYALNVPQFKRGSHLIKRG